MAFQSNASIAFNTQGRDDILPMTAVSTNSDDSQMSGSSLINIGELSKPATVLIEKIAKAVGGIFEPYQMVRVAKAEAEVARVQAYSELEVSDIHRRAMHRFLQEEAAKQANIESVTQLAVGRLSAESSPENIEDDWITNFFDKCRIVSDADMQKLWAAILAGEANNPGLFSRRTVNLMADIDGSDAQQFIALCGFAWTIDTVTPLIFGYKQEIYKRGGITFETLLHLESLGLLKFDGLTGFSRFEVGRTCTVHYHGNAVELKFPKGVEDAVEVGCVLLTQAGEELASVCEANPVDGFFEYVCKRWEANGLLDNAG